MSNKEYRFTLTLNDSKEVSCFFIQHPSERIQYFITKILAYALNYSESLKVRNQVCQGDQPALYIDDTEGKYELWIELRLPSNKRITKALKSSKNVLVYTDKYIPQIHQMKQGNSNFSAFQIELDFDKLSEDLQNNHIKWNIKVDHDIIQINDTTGKLISY